MHPTLWIKGISGNSLANKRIVLGICGSIAAVKCIELVRELIRNGASVRAVMSAESQRIIHSNAMHYATGEHPVTELSGAVEHVAEFGEKGCADLLLIAPCTANTLGKIACGIDDTPVTTFATTALGSKKPIVIVPAMHESMYANPAVVSNIAKLKNMGVAFVEPLHNEFAAKFPSKKEILLECKKALSQKPLAGKNVVIASGALQEDIDPVRILTTRASGKTGVELAKEAYRLGAEVTLIHSNSLGFSGIKEIRTRTNREMHSAVLSALQGADFFLSPAALNDFCVKAQENKISGDAPVQLKLGCAEKLVDEARKKFPLLFIVGFKAETNISAEKLLECAKQKMASAEMQLVVANDVGKQGIGEETNNVILVSRSSCRAVSGKKDLIAREIWKEAVKLISKK
ncbi:MAG: bifunctional phosphopantothenoylcysteine decarboxylase/phosphopantothenate--cysteine ligase CoaBC [Candidatus Diapherotrites archaeon]|nr:bifunctional phosphopantothenoylcysteine decarboxylase/phosphopantothenate--cysteine ligase CoaBC [Candidatus Diapherotrites archaeon]